MERMKQAKEVWRKAFEDLVDDMKGLTREQLASGFFELGWRAADENPPKGTSLIKWQTGEPKERGHYLVTIRYCYAVHADSGREDYAETVTKSIWSGFWQVCCENMHCEVIAWRKLCDIEPYKEE